MQFQPKSEQEIVEENLWPAGEYDYEIVAAYDKTSKSGNEMIELKVVIYNDQGKSQHISDYLLEGVPLKLRNAAYANGLGADYESGELRSRDFEDKTGVCRVGIQKDKAGQYPDKNVIYDYLMKDAALVIVPKGAAIPKKENADLDDEIPF